MKIWRQFVCVGALLMTWALFPVSSWAQEGTQKWIFETGLGGTSSPVIGPDGTIYLGADDMNLYAIDSDGTKKWATFLTDYWAFFSSPAIGADGTVYVGGNTNLYAVKPDGTQKWIFQTEDDVYSSPAIGSDGTIYVGSNDKHLYAINPDGTQKWAFPTGDELRPSRVESSPAIGPDGTIYVGANDSYLYALNADGTQKWAFPTEGQPTVMGGWITSSPAVGLDGTIYVGALDKNFYAINPDGTQKWAFPTENGVGSSPAIGTDGTVYVGSLDGNLYAVSSDGTQKWAFETEGGIISSPAVGADGTIYVGSDDMNLYAVKPDGTRKWAFKTEAEVQSSPAIGPDGTIYVESLDGNIYAINGPSEGGVSAPWPMFRHDAMHTGRSGYWPTPDLWIAGIIHTDEKGPVQAIWKEGGRDDTGGHQVIWGHFYASPTDVTWGSEQNPDLFVKIWVDASGRVDVNFFHVSVPDIQVFSTYKGVSAETGTTTLDRRYIRQWYLEGQSYKEENTEDGIAVEGYSPAGNPSGYAIINQLKIGAVINTDDGPSEGFWRKGGEDTTDAGHEVVWGHFYADPEKFRWASEQNPDLFVKIWFDASGRVDVNFFHVSVPEIEVFSDLPTEGGYDQKGTTITDDRYVRHVYQR